MKKNNIHDGRMPVCLPLARRYSLGVTPAGEQLFRTNHNSLVQVRVAADVVDEVECFPLHLVLVRRTRPSLLLHPPNACRNGYINKRQHKEGQVHRETQTSSQMNAYTFSSIQGETDT